MSRIGNRVLTIPAGVEVNVNGNNITVKGPKGTLEYTFRNNVEVKVEDGKIAVTRKDDSKVSKQLHGTTNSNINNMLIGVSEGYKKELEINGVGYRFQLQGNKVVVSAGYSHTEGVLRASNPAVTAAMVSTRAISGVPFFTTTHSSAAITQRAEICTTISITKQTGGGSGQTGR